MNLEMIADVPRAGINDCQEKKDSWQKILFPNVIIVERVRSLHVKAK